MSYGQNNGQSYYPRNQENNLPPLREALRGVPGLGNGDPRGHVPRSSTTIPYPSGQYYDTGAVPPHGHPQSTTNVHMSVLQQGPSGGLVMRRDASPRSTTSDPSRPYACDYPGCSKRFERPVDLDTHIRSHTGEKRADTLVAGKRSLLNRT
ncbi:hypothetical protein M422DRAFT_265901 [Sphaerobolus stellatus SS14]|uniref:C2H2-type domain-containing protein n=1 Tax=Sphaerobolus stellatus (strain SS14) TaxID=990650 RepID=A0A0C9V489_SPHS4|nr:hypothetical protein M422DRAFT_265901 [Sphaerobolus stellatus SS14]